MIACVCPCDLDFVERLNSLIYVNRAKNIKNRIMEVDELKTKFIKYEEVCAQLRKQLQRYQARICMGPDSTVTESGIYDISCSVEETSVENVLAEAKHDVENKRKTKCLTSKGNKEDDGGDEISHVDGDTAQNSGTATG
ncbi:hypothetical protein HPB51_017388 [Rhipicephalus microplus]|uniref:Kinesin motor domain-containing protein n=1 Tax=Rhipicephalus microplus TaxID=6941 RepID=A0A9J6DB19_RHIMP|nr:hypothetical protein HPB51_017388 [Rhipicephalus microplus]